MKTLDLFIRVIRFAAVVGTVAFGQERDVTSQIILALRSGNPTEAERLCDESLRVAPDDPRVWTLKGVGYESLGQSTEALSAYYRALSMGPDYLPALLGAARIEFRNRSQRAIPLLEAAARVRPSDLTIPVMLGELAFQRDDCTGALASFERGTTLLEKFPQALEQYGVCLLRTDHNSQAVPVFEKLLERSPDSDSARYNLALVQSAAGQFSASIKTLGPLMDRNKPDPEVMSLAADASESMFDTPRAFDMLRRALAAYPDDPEFYISLAKLSLSHQSFQAGIEILNSGIRRIPQIASLYMARGILYMQLGDWKSSDQDLHRAQQLDPKLPFGSAALGLAQLQAHEPAQAQRSARQSLENQPDDPYLNYVLAESAHEMGVSPGTVDFEEAMACAQKAVRLQPNFSQARELLSRLYEDSGKMDEAIAESREAVRRSPADETALYHLILVTKKAGNNSELPDLLKRFRDLREASSRKEAQLRRFALLQRSAKLDGSR